MQVGFIGLGRMGGNMAKKLLTDGHDVIAWNRSPEKLDIIKKENPQIQTVASVEALVNVLQIPRVVWSMLPAGDVTEQMLVEIGKYVTKGDIVIEGSNAQYKDTQRRYEAFKKKGIRFLGIGVSGGIVAAIKGYPTMVGGDKSAYEHIVPLLDSLGKPYGGHAYFGEGGAGHFVKMIHNGIEYGIMQSMAEGFDVLEHAPYKFDLLEVAKLWQKGTLVSGFMLDRAVDVLEDDPHLEKITGVIGISGEADWTVDQAKEENIPVPSIALALDYRRQSQKDPIIQNSYTGKMVAAFRNAFGGHAVKKKD